MYAKNNFEISNWVEVPSQNKSKSQPQNSFKNMNRIAQKPSYQRQSKPLTVAEQKEKLLSRLKYEYADIQNYMPKFSNIRVVEPEYINSSEFDQQLVCYSKLMATIQVKVERIQSDISQPSTLACEYLPLVVLINFNESMNYPFQLPTIWFCVEIPTNHHNKKFGGMKKHSTCDWYTFKNQEIFNKFIGFRTRDETGKLNPTSLTSILENLKKIVFSSFTLLQSRLERSDYLSQLKSFSKNHRDWILDTKNESLFEKFEVESESSGSIESRSIDSACPSTNFSLSSSASPSLRKSSVNLSQQFTNKLKFQKDFAEHYKKKNESAKLRQQLEEEKKLMMIQQLTKTGLYADQSSKKPVRRNVEVKHKNQEPQFADKNLNVKKVEVPKYHGAEADINPNDMAKTAYEYWNVNREIADFVPVIKVDKRVRRKK